MMDTLKDRLAWRRARKLLMRRKPLPWSSAPAERRVLLVLPVEERNARPAWRFVEDLQLDPERTLPIVPTGEIAFAPITFLGRVKPLEPSDIGRLGLPSKRYLRDVWAFEPEVAMCLTQPFDLAAALIVGGSPAAFRIGFFDEVAEPFFDLMASGGDGMDGGLRALTDTLGRIRPPIIAPAEGYLHPARPAWR